MKKFTLAAATAMMALGASAQYTVNPGVDAVLKDGAKYDIAYLVISDNALEKFTSAGGKATNLAPDDVTRFFYIWDGTFLAGDGSMPRVDMEEGDYLSLTVGTVGWSGGGYNIAKDHGEDISNFSDATRFHIAYMSPTNNGPASTALILFDGDPEGNSPAKIAVGDSFNDNGAIYPTVGPKMTDEWQGVDISFADIKKLYPTFNLAGLDSWSGNVVSILGGGVNGQTIAFDAMYFYTPAAEGSIHEVGAEATDFIVTENTINAVGSNGIVLYNLAGQTVKATAGTVLGINNLPAGVYIAKSGNKARKVVVK